MNMIRLYLVLLECLECNGSEITSPVILMDQKSLDIFSLWKYLYSWCLFEKRKIYLDEFIYFIIIYLKTACPFWYFMCNLFIICLEKIHPKTSLSVECDLNGAMHFLLVCVWERNLYISPELSKYLYIYTTKKAPF